MKRFIVTGSAGFVGSNFCDLLLQQGKEVVAIDNFSSGRREFLSSAMDSDRFELHDLDLLSKDETISIFRESKADCVVHLASNADVRYGLQHPRRDLEQGVLVTHNVLEATRIAEIGHFAFSSTGSVYGEPSVFPTPECCPFPAQTSLYAAGKLAAEGFIQAYATGFGIKACIFRFVSLLGERYTHGHIFDFIRKLEKNSREIEILGDGKQTKSYLYVGDCVRAMLHLLENQSETLSIFNLGTDECKTVDQSLDIICQRMDLSPKRLYQGGQRGWVGDSPLILLDCTKARSHGWSPQLSIEQGIVRTVDYLLSHPEILHSKVPK